MYHDVHCLEGSLSLFAPLRRLLEEVGCTFFTCLRGPILPTSIFLPIGQGGVRLFLQERQSSLFVVLRSSVQLSYCLIPLDRLQPVQAS